MAANSSVRSIVNQIWRKNNSISAPSSPLSFASSRRAAYSSVYDKNADDHIHSEHVPDDVIHATNSTKYWAPHPHTGVFGPPGEQSTADASAAAAAAGSVLEEKAWFRPSSLEDLEKPHPIHPQ